MIEHMYNAFSFFNTKSKSNIAYAICTDNLTSIANAITNPEPPQRLRTAPSGGPATSGPAGFGGFSLQDFWVSRWQIPAKPGTRKQADCISPCSYPARPPDSGKPYSSLKPRPARFGGFLCFTLADSSKPRTRKQPDNPTCATQEGATLRPRCQRRSALSGCCGRLPPPEPGNACSQLESLDARAKQARQVWPAVPQAASVPHYHSERDMPIRVPDQE